MTRIIRFTKLRYLMFALSALVIIAGFAGTISRGGFNLGIDFQAGLNQRIQIAPVGMTISYNGSGSATLDFSEGAAVLETRGEAGVVRNRFPLADHGTMTALASALNSVDGVSAVAVLPSYETGYITTGLSFPVSLEEEAQPINVSAAGGNGGIEIAQVRGALETFENPQVQVVGDPASQEFLLRIADPEGDKKDLYERQIVQSLEAAFGADTAVVKQSDYVGPRFSRDLAQQSISLTLMALVLILIYLWIRFQLGFAVSSITALLHDVAIMLGFIGVFRLEVSTTTIAAVLTIVGYSLNDTIVVFDRVRENMALMKDRNIRDIIDTSITQSLSRTLMTSVTTMLAVLALYIFGTGPIQDFALNLIVGIIVGTYSSIFIASPVLLGWHNISEKRRAKKELARHGGKKIEAPKAEKTEVKSEKKEAAPPEEAEIPKVDRKMKGKRQTKKKK
jgi:preprotein translocase subunit SecF